MWLVLGMVMIILSWPFDSNDLFIKGVIAIAFSLVLCVHDIAKNTTPRSYVMNYNFARKKSSV